MTKLQRRMFSELLFWSGKKIEGENSYYLNKFSLSLATYFLCMLTREQYSAKEDVTFSFETLSSIGAEISEFAAWTDHARPQRVHEALEQLLAGAGVFQGIAQKGGLPPKILAHSGLSPEAVEGQGDNVEKPNDDGDGRDFPGPAGMLELQRLVLSRLFGRFVH